MLKMEDDVNLSSHLRDAYKGRKKVDKTAFRGEGKECCVELCSTFFRLFSCLKILFCQKKNGIQQFKIEMTGKGLQKRKLCYKSISFSNGV